MDLKTKTNATVRLDGAPALTTCRMISLSSSSANSPPPLHLPPILSTFSSRMLIHLANFCFCLVSLPFFLLFNIFGDNFCNRCKRLNQLGLHPLVLSKAGAKAFAIKAKNWSESADRFLKLCANAGNVEASYTLGMVSSLLEVLLKIIS